MARNERFGLGKVYRDAVAEALRRGDRRLSSEHVVLALLVDPAAVTARALDVDLDTAHAPLQRLDREALAAVGIVLDLDGSMIAPPGSATRLPFTPAAKALFTGLRKTAGRGRIGEHHVLLALLDRQRPDPAAELLDALGVDRAGVRRRLGVTA